MCWCGSQASHCRRRDIQIWNVAKQERTLGTWTEMGYIAVNSLLLKYTCEYRCVHVLVHMHVYIFVYMYMCMWAHVHISMSWFLIPFPSKKEPGLFKKMTASRIGVQMRLEHLMSESKGLIIITTNDGTCNKDRGVSLKEILLTKSGTIWVKDLRIVMNCKPLRKKYI